MTHPEPCTEDHIRRLLRELGRGATFQVIATSPGEALCFNDAPPQVITRMGAYATPDGLRLVFLRARYGHMGFGPPTLGGISISRHVVAVEAVDLDDERVILYAPERAYLVRAKPSEGDCPDEALFGLHRSFTNALQSDGGTEICVPGAGLAMDDEAGEGAVSLDGGEAQSRGGVPPSPVMAEPPALPGTYVVLWVQRRLDSARYDAPWRVEGAVVLDPAGDLHVCLGPPDSCLGTTHDMAYAAAKTLEIMSPEDFLWSLFGRSSRVTTYAWPTYIEASSVDEALAVPPEAREYTDRRPEGDARGGRVFVRWIAPSGRHGWG